jgi:hypothetical protein
MPLFHTRSLMPLLVSETCSSTLEHLLGSCLSTRSSGIMLEMVTAKRIRAWRDSPESTIREMLTVTNECMEICKLDLDPYVVSLFTYSRNSTLQILLEIVVWKLFYGYYFRRTIGQGSVLTACFEVDRLESESTKTVCLRNGPQMIRKGAYHLDSWWRIRVFG